MDVNGGLNRTGVDPEEAIELAKFIHSQPNLSLKGVQTYVGHLQHVTSFEERKKLNLVSYKLIILNLISIKI